MPALSPERLQAPVVEDEEIDGAQALETRRGAAVAMGEGELVEEFRDPDYRTERLSRQALWPSAQASQLLPTPVGPVMTRLS